MNKKDLIYIGVILIGILLSYLLLYKPLQEYDEYDINIAKKEEQIKYLEKQIQEKDSLFQVIENQRDSTLNIISNRKETIKYIIKDYDEKINKISGLNSDSSISYFKSWINSNE